MCQAFYGQIHIYSIPSNTGAPHSFNIKYKRNEKFGKYNENITFVKILRNEK